MRLSRLLVSVLIALFHLSASSGMACADSIEISDRVWGHYQEYLRTIGSAKPGAFAVSRDGYSSYYVYCRDVRCMSGPTYSNDALRRCEDMANQECFVFAIRQDIKVAYTLAPKSAPVVSQSPVPAAVVTSEPEEPPFESPLADGTIVLSRKSASKLEQYLKAVDRHGTYGFFFVATNGRATGTFTCAATRGADLPQCPMKTSSAWTDPKPNLKEAKERAADACRVDSGAECVMLFASDIQREEYKVVE